MTERPNAVLVALLAVAAGAAAFVAAAFATFSAPDVVLTVLGALTVCAALLGDVGRIPFPALVVTVLMLASAFAIVRTLTRHLREQRVIDALPLERLDDTAARAVAETLAAGGVYVTPSSRPAAFCFGTVRPRVVMTAGLLARLDADERAAALWHEAHHARDHVPLKCLLARLAAAAFFWLPVLGDLRDRYLLVKELSADRLAVARTSTSALAGALLAVSDPVRGTVGLADAAATRVDRLVDPAAALPPLFRKRRLVVTAGSAALIVLLLSMGSGVDVLAGSDELWSMLTSPSLHGLPGMAGGLVASLGAIAVGAHLRRRRTRA